MSTKPIAETPTRHPLAIAWDEWLASNEGQEARAANTLPHNTNHYLENRLHRAFDAGAKAATISPSDFEQLIRLRSTAQEAERFLAWWCESTDANPPGGVRGATRILAALREALTPKGEKS